MPRFFIYLLLILITFSACRPDEPTPKPRGYYRIDLQDKAYTTFDSAGFPYSFRYPVYGRITQDTNLIKQEGEPYWVNIYIPSYDATIYLSYKTITSSASLDQLVNESFRLTNAHNVKADYIKSPLIETPQGYTGVMYSVGGNAASAYQFFLTDDERNFIRGSLYFNVTPNADSLAPLYAFLKQDLDTIIHSLQFK